MPAVTGTLVPPVQNSPPTSPVPGQIYYDSVLKQVLYWDGAAWVQGPAATIYDSDQIGTVKTFAGQTIPTGWMLCDGRSLLRADYPELFAQLGTMHGSGDGASFNIPDLRSSFIYGASAANAQGASGGEASHVLTAAETALIDHDHDMVSANLGSAGPALLTSGGKVYALGRGAAGSASTLPALVASSGTYYGIGVGGVAIPAPRNGSAHNNLPPYVVLAFIVKAKGLSIDSGAVLTGAQGPPGNGLLAVQSIRGTGSGYQAFGTATGNMDCYQSGTSGQRMQLQYTPTQNAWWDVRAHLAIVQATSAVANQYAYLTLYITPADVDGMTSISSIFGQRNDQNTYGPRSVQQVFKLAASTAYTVYMQLQPAATAATFQYHQGQASQTLQALAYSR